MTQSTAQGRTQKGSFFFYFNTLSATLLAGVLLTGCGDNKYKGLSNSELQEKFSRCENASGLSPGGAIICDNVYRECEDRAKRTKRRACY